MATARPRSHTHACTHMQTRTLKHTHEAPSRRAHARGHRSMSSHGSHRSIGLYRKTVLDTAQQASPASIDTAQVCVCVCVRVCVCARMYVHLLQI